ncbi:MAG: undecaprenyldiphospho-muramoylpentapeptide beta-N-acetylglucosaminyltransferase [Verrucomicrobiota bacterium]|nr:undecaprenyldiphospho-muramoylpentapeptide beta-N-acetylglucosaminyltransferase [Verrucomicrobiota bacterium]
MKLAIAGGGTGGHLFPALAVAEILHERGDEALIFISEKEIDVIATRDRSEFRFEKLPGIGMPRIFSPAIFHFLKRFNESLAPCRAIYKKFQPDAVLGMGGFTSTAPILAGRMRKVPTFVHESNAIPGKANRLNARLTNAVLLGFEECAAHFPNATCIVTGTPIRRGLARRIPQQVALAKFGFKNDRKTLLVMGGSQGAHGINELIIKALPHLKELPLQFLHLAGTQDEQLVTANYRRENIPAYVGAFHKEMDEVYSAADFALARSGAASLAELSQFALPSILIPYPHASENHQALNAEIFARAGAAAVLEEASTTPEMLANELRSLLDPARSQTMSEQSHRLAPHNAAQRVLETIDKYL